MLTVHQERWLLFGSELMFSALLKSLVQKDGSFSETIFFPYLQADFGQKSMSLTEVVSPKASLLDFTIMVLSVHSVILLVCFSFFVK
jgi:hypothetical protein